MADSTASDQHGGVPAHARCRGGAHGPGDESVRHDGIPQVGAAHQVAIVESHALVGEALELALSRQRFDVQLLTADDCGTTPGALVSTVLRSGATIVLLAASLGASDPHLGVITALARNRVAVVVLTHATDEAVLGHALRRGASAVLPKVRPLGDLVSVLRRLSRGAPAIGAAERDALIGHAVRGDSDLAGLRERFERLTHREAQILGFLMSGYTATEIAAASCVAKSTVRTQIKSVLGKLEVSSQIGAVGAARRLRWTPLPNHRAHPDRAGFPAPAWSTFPPSLVRPSTRVPDTRQLARRRSAGP